MIVIKNRKAIESLREANRITAETLALVESLIKPGVTTKMLDEAAEEFIRKNGATPGFKGYGGFPGTICASVNEAVVHGIPNDKYVLKEGDIISIDTGAVVNGYNGDAARTFGVGKISEEAQRLIDVTKQSFFEGIAYAKVGYRLSDISHAVQKYVENNGFSVVRDYVGHGIGKDMHEDPQIPNFGEPGYGPRLKQGMTLAIEPMVNQGTYFVRVLSDNWTVVTTDGKLSAHYENSILITDDEPEVLSLL